MATALGERAPEIPPEPPPDWSPVPKPAIGGGGGGPLHVLLRAVVGLVVAAVLWRLGHHGPAVALVAVLTTITAASLLSERFAAAVERVVAFVQRVAGRGLALLLLGGVQLLVFTPLWLLLRLARRDVLALGARPDDETFWRPVPRGRRTLYERPFAYERIPRVGMHGDRYPFPRLRAVLGLVLLVVVLDLAVGATVNGVRSLNSDDGDAQLGGLVGQDVPAAAGETWRVALGSEIDGLWKSKRYDPYLGWKVPDFDGRHVHVAGGVRRSYRPAAGGADAPSVYFFGGSAMFGMYQRDEHTIPSEFARLAEADGIPVRVANYGSLAYVNWQEALLLEQLATAGSVPDLAVFYDGFNEIVSQFQLGPHADITHLESQEIDRRLGLGQRGDDFVEEPSLPDAAYRAWADVSAVHRLGRRLGVTSTPATRDEPVAVSSSIWPGDQADRPGARGRMAASIHARGVDLAGRLADSYGFQAAFFWQPSLYSKRLDPGEEEVNGWLGTDPDAWREADRVARSRMAAPVQDVSGALDGVDRPVMYDFVHTNELGAKVMARVLYERLRPQLLELSGEGRR